MAQKITLDEFCNQWVRNNSTTLMANKLEWNIFDFVTQAGEYTLEKFRSSFSAQRFCGDGKPWLPRQSAWGKRYSHPILDDTGTLKNSIKGETSRLSIKGQRNNGERLFERRAGYHIYTTEKSVSMKGKRSPNKKKRDQHYAAVHNTDPRFGLYTVNQYSNRLPAWRQFIGFNPKISDHIANELIDIIFKGFPQ